MGKGILNADYTNGAYSWQGKDFKQHYDGMHAYESYYKVGFIFCDPSHDIFSMGNHKSGNTKWDYKYESTGAAGKTIFMTLTPEWKRANGYEKLW